MPRPRERSPARRPASRPPLYLAQCARGLEEVVAGELLGLGARHVEAVAGGARFAASPDAARRALLWLRSAVRLLEPVVSGAAATPDQLYELAAGVRWEELVGTRHTFAVKASVSERGFGDARFAALRVKDAIADRIRSRRGRRPDVDRRDPDVPVRVIVRRGEAHLFRDLAGGSLHRRGYRPIQVRSPLPEATAAGLLLLTGWDGASPLLDPMCGSGTFVLEAALLALERAPGLERGFAAERFPDADPKLWGRLRQEARDRQRRRLPAPIVGSDRHEGALGIARESARRAGLEGQVELRLADAATLVPDPAPGVVVANPPWGERLGEGRELAESWRALGGLLRRCPGARAYVLSGAPGLTRHLGLKASRRWPLRVGPQDVRWLRYEILPRRG
ncbi:MAG: THUMP domain-containing protein [Thermoanaerobaculia bacterium]|nr:THUMP domain-containing protein [Thermoanaerobaculia bacterium]